jgi:hypothetical protein
MKKKKKKTKKEREKLRCVLVYGYSSFRPWSVQNFFIYYTMLILGKQGILHHTIPGSCLLDQPGGSTILDFSLHAHYLYILVLFFYTNHSRF